jgi:hypothetical protein
MLTININTVLSIMSMFHITIASIKKNVDMYMYGEIKNVANMLKKLI